MRWLFLPTALLFSAAALFGDNLAANPGFEDKTAGWSMFAPLDTPTTANPQFSVVNEKPHSASACAKLWSDDFARYALGTKLIPCVPKEHFRISVWMRAGPDFVPMPGTPGIVVRLAYQASGSNWNGFSTFIEPNGATAQFKSEKPGDLAAVTSLPIEWTKVEAVVEIPADPEGVKGFTPAIFVWRGKGAIYFDDFSVEKVEAASPSPAVKTP